MKEELEKLLSCGDSWAAERAQMALNFMNEHAAGNLTDSEYKELMEDLTDSEYKELMEDLVRTDAVDAAETNLEVKGILVGAISGAVSVIG